MARRTSCSERVAEGASLDEAVREAQELGFAEADPSADLDGLDAQRKLALLGAGGLGRDSAARPHCLHRAFAPRPSSRPARRLTNACAWWRAPSDLRTGASWPRSRRACFPWITRWPRRRAKAMRSSSKPRRASALRSPAKVRGALAHRRGGGRRSARPVARTLRRGRNRSGRGEQE